MTQCEHYAEEKERAEQLVGDGVGQPNFFLTDGPFMPEELTLLDANFYMPAIFPPQEKTSVAYAI